MSSASKQCDRRIKSDASYHHHPRSLLAFFRCVDCCLIGTQHLVCLRIVDLFLSDTQDLVCLGICNSFLIGTQHFQGLLPVALAAAGLIKTALSVLLKAVIDILEMDGVGGGHDGDASGEENSSEHCECLRFDFVCL